MTTTDAPPTVRPYCPQCRERDKVVLPSDPEPERKWFQEPYCTRCKCRLRNAKPHRLQPPEFD
jgi:hypothetical protein